MKKTVITIAITALLTAVLMISGYFIYTKIINKDNNANSNMTKKNENNSENVENQIPNDIKNISLEEWRKVIALIYKEHYGYKPDNITCTEVGPNIIYVTIYHNTELVAEYTLDAETGIASSPTERTANFFKGIFLDNLSTKVNFKNNEFIAIGFIDKGKEAEFKEIYFNSDIEYESLTTVVEGDEYQFIVIPKSLDATLRIWKYNVSENGELYSEGLLLEAVGTPLLIKTQCTEVFPRVGVEYENDNTKFTIPLMISGMDGKFTFTDYGITTTFVDALNPQAFEDAIQENTKLVYIETLGNPNSDVVDIEAIAKIAHKHGLPLVIDNTFGTPYLIRPIEYGADVVIHSETKFIGGHGTTIGSVIVDAGKFDWAAHADKFPQLVERNPSYHGVSFAKDEGAAAYITRIRAILLRDMGATLSPIHAWIFLQGLETLSLRVERQVENTLKVVEYLKNHPQVESVSHPSVSTDPSQQAL